MGFFADEPVTNHEELTKKFLKEIDERVKNGHPAMLGRNIGRNDVLKAIAREAWDILGTTTLLNDPCNITLFTKYGTFVHRNPYCQPPPKPIPPPGNGFHVGDSCNCDIDVFFAFHQKRVGGKEQLVGGAGYGQWYFDNPNLPPHGALIESPDPNSQSPYGLRETFNNYTEDIYIKRFQPLDTDGNNVLLQDGISIFYSIMTFSYEDVTEQNGYVDPSFPLYKFFRFNPATTSYSLDIVTAPWQVVAIKCRGCQPNKWIDPPPPPPPKECCMCCCNDGNNKDSNDALLKLILKRIGNLPATVPNNIADSNNKGTHSIESLAEMIFWHVKQMDAISGQYPIPLTIKADPTDSNSKEQHLSLPNQAETLAEILGLLITTKRDTHANLIATIKGMTEAGMTKNIATQTLDVALANAEFLGYKLDHIKRSIPIAFTPGGKNVAEVLKPTNIDVVSYENKDTTDLQDDLKKLLTMAARWNAQNWRALGHDAAKSLRNNLIDKPQTSIDTHNALKEETFAQFIKEAQAGFTTKPGVTDSTDPWGNPESEAPIIREIGTAADVTNANKNSTTPQTTADKNTIVNAGNVQKISSILKAL